MFCFVFRELFSQHEKSDTLVSGLLDEVGTFVSNMNPCFPLSLWYIFLDCKVATFWMYYLPFSLLFVPWKSSQNWMLPHFPYSLHSNVI